MTTPTVVYTFSEAVGGQSMDIKLIPDPSVSNAPAGFAAAVQSAADIFDQTFTNNITVNITYEWGEITIGNEPPSQLSSNVSEGAPVGGEEVLYSTLRSWLAADPFYPVIVDAYLPPDSSKFPIT